MNGLEVMARVRMRGSELLTLAENIAKEYGVQVVDTGRWSFPKIAKTFDRDHSTVMDGVAAHRRRAGLGEQRKPHKPHRSGTGLKCHSCGHRSPTRAAWHLHNAPCYAAQKEMSRVVLADVAKEYQVQPELILGARRHGRQMRSIAIVCAMRTIAIWRLWLLGIRSGAISEVFNLDEGNVRAYFRQFEAVRAQRSEVAA